MLPLLRVALIAAVISAATSCTTTPTPTATATPSVLVTTQPPTQEPTVAPTTASPTPTDPLSPKPGLETAPPPGQPQCKGPALLVTDADTVVSPTYKREVFVIRTTGGPCQLRGYPTVRLLGSDGAPLAVKVQQGGYGLPAETVATYTISRDTSLSFEIGTSRDGSCQDVDAITAILPGTTTNHRASTVLRVCGSTVGVSPVHHLKDID